jgi:hypothetical protein
MAAFQLSAWGAVRCSSVLDTGCGILRNGLEWIGHGFPHAFLWPLSMLVPSFWIVTLILTAADLVLILAFWRWAPARLSVWPAAGILLGWLLLTALSIWAAPYLMNWVWEATH